MGAGAIQSNMPVFGVEQIEEPKASSRYFNKHVVAVGIAAASSKLIISSIQDTDATKLFVGYLIAVVMLLISIVLFIIRRRYYIHIKPYDSVVIKCIPVIKNALQTWYAYNKDQHAMDEIPTLSVQSNDLQSSGKEESIRTEARRSELLDFAKVVNYGKYPDWIVDDVKSLRRLLFVSILLIPYWIIYDQVFTSFPAQRRQMKMPTNETYKAMISTLVSFGDPITLMSKFAQ